MVNEIRILNAKLERDKQTDGQTVRRLLRDLYFQKNCLFFLEIE